MFGGLRHMAEPRLRTVNKAVAPFAVNKFPTSFVETLAQNIVYMMATKQSMSLEGNEWEQKLFLDKRILNIRIKLD